MRDEEEADVDWTDVGSSALSDLPTRARQPHEWQSKASPHETAYALGALHAEAMMVMNKAGWPLGGIQQILIGTRRLNRQERKQRGIKDKTENVYLEIHAITCFPGIYFTRSGAVYREDRFWSRGDSPCILVDFATDERMYSYHYQEAFQHIIERGNEFLANLR